MKISKKLSFKRLIAFLCVLSLSIAIFPARPAKAATIGNLALALEAVQELGTSAAKAKIIDFATAAGYTANAEYISASASATLAKGATVALGSITLAILSTVGGAYAGTSYAYEQTSSGFKAMFSYEDCLQYIWKKAMGADDETLLAFLYASMDPENIQSLADGTYTFEYNLDLSRAVAYTMYDAHFSASPAYGSHVAMEHYGPNPFEGYSDIRYNDAAGWENWRPIDSYFPAETYLAGAKNYIATQYPDFEADFWIMSSSYLVGYGPRYTAREGYNGAPTMYAYDFPEGSTPIFLYNQTTGRSYLTTYENPSYEAVGSTCDRIRLEAFTYPGLYTADYSQFGISYHDAGTSTGSTSSFYTPTSYTYYYWSGTSQSTRTLNPAEYGHFVNRLNFDDYSIYGIPVYTMDAEGVLSPYNLISEQDVLPEPDSVVAPEDSSAGYNSTLDVTEEILKTEPVVDSYVDSSGSPVSEGSTESIERDPEPTPTPQPTPPTYDDGTTPIFPVFPEFPDFFGEGFIPSLMSGFAVFSSFLAVCLEVLPFEITDAFWWCFAFLLAIALIGVLI